MQISPRGLYYADNRGAGVFAELAVWCLSNTWAAGGGWPGCASPWLCGPLRLCLAQGQATLFVTWCLLCFSLLQLQFFDFWEPHQSSERNSVKTTCFRNKTRSGAGFALERFRDLWRSFHSILGGCEPTGYLSYLLAPARFCLWPSTGWCGDVVRHWDVASEQP